MSKPTPTQRPLAYLAGLIAIAGVASTLSRGASLSWYPVYVVRSRTDAIDVWAASADEATRTAGLWTTSGEGPSEEFPFSGPTDPRGFGGDAPAGANVYARDARPYVRLSDRRGVMGAWYVTSSPPAARSSAFKTPTLEEWRSLTDALPATSYDLDATLGTPVDAEVRSVNLDAPAWKPSWSPYRRYIVTEASYVWYYQATSKAAAEKAARAEWIDGGVYALGRRLQSSEVGDWYGYRAYLDWVAAGSQKPPGSPEDWAPPSAPSIPDSKRALYESIPARRWAALLATACEPRKVRDRIPNSTERVSATLPAQRAPYDDRSYSGATVPFFGAP